MSLKTQKKRSELIEGVHLIILYVDRHARVG